MNEEEKNRDLERSSIWIDKSTKLTSVNFSATLHDQARKHGISLRNAIEFGILFKLADKDGFGYPPCNLLNKMEKVIKHRIALTQEIESLRTQLNIKDKLSKDE